MKSVSDDGHPVAVSFAKMIVFAFLFLVACHKPQRKIAIVAQPTEVLVSPPKVVDVEKKKPKKKLYITFDDGPNKGTKNVLDIVQDEQVPVTFFVVGEHVFASNSQHKVWDSLRMASHIEICNHSYTHAHNRYDKFYEEPKQVVADFKRTKDSLRLSNNIVRTPGRNIWRIDSLQFTDMKKSKAAADSLQQAGFIVMGWDLEWHYDHKTMAVTASADEMIQQIDSAFAKKKLMQQDHLVLLAHDQVYAKSHDSVQLRQFLQKLKQKNEYELALVTSYPRSASMLRDTGKVKAAP